MSPSPIPTRSLGSASDAPNVGAVGYGCMMLTWTDPGQVADDTKAFEAIKTAIDSGATFLNSGAFYGVPPNGTANLELLKRFFDKYPDYAGKCTLSVKGGARENNPHRGMDASVEGLRKDLQMIKAVLGDKKEIDIYETARVDRNLTIEEAIGNMAILQKEGLFKHIGVSEIHPEALRKAAKVAPIAAVEIELSLFSLEPEALETVKIADELGIAVVAYSPLGRGLLTGRYRSADDLPDGDMRKHSPRFQGENFKLNLEIVDKLNELAEKKGCTGGQLALAYLLGMSDKVIPIPGSSSEKRTIENINAANVDFTSEDKKAIDEILGKFEIKGTRYPEALMAMNWGKGKQ